MRELEFIGHFPGPVAEEFYHDRSYFSAIRGPLGSGKTQTSILKLLQLASEQEPNAQGIRPVRLLAIRNTYPDLESTTIRDWAAVTEHLGPIRMTHPPTQNVRWSLDDGTVVDLDVLFLALDRDDHVRKLRGTQATIVWLNETKELVKAVLDMATRPLGRYPSMALGGVRCTRECIVGDFNAPDEDHWAAQLELHPEPGWKVFVQPGGVKKNGGVWIPNPDAENVDNLPEDYYRKMLANKSEDWIAVNLANRFGSSVDGKPIHPEFSRAQHVEAFDVIPGSPIIFGLDFGLTPACTMAQDVQGTLFVFDEIVTDDFSAEEMAREMRHRRATAWATLDWGNGWCDPAGVIRAESDKGSAVQTMRSAGFKVLPAGSSNQFQARRDALGNRLRRLNGQRPAFLIHPRCKTLIKALSGHYQFRRMKVAGDERYADTPDKNEYSHIAESCQYLSVGLGDGQSNHSMKSRTPRQGLRYVRRS